MANVTIVSRLSNRAFRMKKALYQTFIRPSRSRSIIFIMGCQRSGTTLLSDIFHRDMRAKSYGEFSNLTSQDKIDGLRLNPLDDVRKELKKPKAPLIVIKPLVESQNATHLLEAFPESYVLWVYRNFRDVAQSNIKKFGIRNGINDLRPIAEEQHNNWRAEKVSSSTKRIVSEYFSENMKPNDAHALCWYARNILFFDQNLQTNPRVMICRYENLVTSPSKIMRGIYERIRQSYPGDSIVSGTHSSSIRKGQDIEISPEIEQLCDHLLHQLDVVFYRMHPEVNDHRTMRGEVRPI